MKSANPIKKKSISPPNAFRENQRLRKEISELEKQLRTKDISLYTAREKIDILRKDLEKERMSKFNTTPYSYWADNKTKSLIDTYKYQRNGALLLVVAVVPPLVITLISLLLF